MHVPAPKRPRRWPQPLRGIAVDPTYDASSVAPRWIGWRSSTHACRPERVHYEPPGVIAIPVRREPGPNEPPPRASNGCAQLFEGAFMRTPANIAGHPIHPMLVPLPIGLWIF